MEFYQHVFGRVSEGYRSQTEGYQLAALTDALASHTEMIENLNQLSFFSLRGGSGQERRYSFFQPAEGYLAFGCCRMARDLTGSTGAFAHHLICDLDTFVNNDLSPAMLLREFRFFESEDQLPLDRSLPVVETEGSILVPPEPRWHAFGLRVVDSLLGRSTGATPMAILNEEETWAVLAAVFYFLPRQEAARCSFSTLFARADDYTPWFRIVFVPDRNLVPSDNYIYQIITPDDPVPSLPPPTSFTDYWRNYPGKGETLLKLVSLLRQYPKSRVQAREMLATLQPFDFFFRRAIESLKIQGYLGVLMSDPAWFTEYWLAGSSIAYSALQNELWTNPDILLIPFLEASRRLQQETLCDAALEDLANRVASNMGGLDLVASLQNTRYLDAFLNIAASRLQDSSLCRLAHALRSQEFYANQLHDAVANRILDRIRKGDRIDVHGVGNWLRAEVITLPQSPFLRAVADLTEWVDQTKRSSFGLANYDISEQQYRTLLPVVWIAGPRSVPLAELVRTIYRRDYSRLFFAQFTPYFKQCDRDRQEEFLAACADVCGPYVGQEETLLEIIETTRDAAYLARFFRLLLSKRYPAASASLSRLQSIEQERKRKLFGW